MATESNDALAASIQTRPAIVARQPIFDKLQRTFAHEILFRELHTAPQTAWNGDAATSRVIFNAIVEIGLDRLVGSELAFFNFTREFILSRECALLPYRRVVLEILEDSIPDPEFLKRLATLREEGYRFALDDFSFQEQLLPFLPFCSFIKIDLRAVERVRLAREMPFLRAQPAKLLAEKVETAEEFEYCQKLGFEYYQGYFFCKPRLISSSTMPTNRLNLYKLVSRLQEPRITAEELEEIICKDPSLSYRLQRYVNSVAVGLPRTIDSIRHAVRMVGLDHIRTLASLLMLSSFDDKPRELIKTSVVRARLCHLLGEGQSYQYGAYFTVGLFSTLDAFLDCSIENAIEQLSLSDEIRDALIFAAGPCGRVLSAVIAFERHDWTKLESLRFDAGRISTLYMTSLAWAEEMLR